MAGFLTAPGEPVNPDALTVPRAIETCRLLAAALHPFARLVRCRSTATADIVVLDVEVQVPQHRVHDIRRQERLAAEFPSDDQQRPDVLALRADFPCVPHLNLSLAERPRSLCLYDRPWDEIKLRWTAATFVEHIRSWLALTARGHLHADDQPLEPLLLAGTEELILPATFFEPEVHGAPLLYVHAFQAGPDRDTYIAEPSPPSPGDPSERPHFVATTVSCPPRQHGVIHRPPRNLSELHDFMAAAGGDLLDSLRVRLKEWQQSTPDFPQLLDARVIIIAHLPKTRVAGGPPERTEIRAFITAANVKQLGHAIGVWDSNWDIKDGIPGLLLEIDDTKHGAEISLVMLSPRPTLSRSLASQLGGVAVPVSAKIAAVGVGALGSQVFLNLIRSGFGQWTLVDEDVLLPHNTARHALHGPVGAPKAEALAMIANLIIDGDDIASAITTNIISPGDQAEQLDDALRESAVVLDMSASIAVARYLTHDLKSDARRISLFLSPSGAGLTLLAEDSHRHVPLNVVEMQFYRELVTNTALAGFLEVGDGQIRPGQSCRDTTTRMSQDLVALHAAIASRALRTAIASQDPVLRIWQLHETTLTVQAFDVAVSEGLTKSVGEWTVSTDCKLLDRLSELRAAKLPQETGGVLIGHYDMQRKIIYVVDTIPSPPDSVEWPTVYIRGCQGLEDAVQEIQRTTMHMLEYVGEWHSHPDGYPSSPSPDDLTVLGWLTERMDTDGLPALLAIAGQALRPTFLLAGLAVTGRLPADDPGSSSTQSSG